MSGPVAENYAEAGSQARDAAELEIRPSERGEEQECDQFVASSPTGTLFHLAAWQAVVEGVLKRRWVSLVARRGRKITGIFPIGLVRSRLFGDSMVSLPLAVYGGICADNVESHSGLLAAGRN